VTAEAAQEEYYIPDPPKIKKRRNIKVPASPWSLATVSRTAGILSA
jgi:hypothetical protein